MYIYRTYFKLTANVIDFEAARDYLKNDEMKRFMKGDDRIPDNVYNYIDSIEWILKDTDSGIIELRTTRELTEKELKDIISWVSGQCSDGIGEGFEQQDFANYSDEDYDDEDYEDYVMTSFDWMTNEYLFEYITKD